MSTLNNTALVSMNVASNGTFTANNDGCNFTGTSKPRASGKNVFDVSVTFGAAPCSLPGTKATGIALTYILANGKRQLVAAAVDASRTHNSLVFGTR